MEFNAPQQYRPSSNGSFTSTRPTSRQAAQMMYPYGNIAMQQHHHHQQQSPPQHLHQQIRPSPPYPSWPVPQTHDPYAHMQKGPITNSRDSYEQIATSSEVSASQSPALSAATFRNDIRGHEALGTTDYFPGIIDTSPWGQKVCEELDAFPSIDPDMAEFTQGLMNHDENTPIIDLRQYHSGMDHHEADNMATFNHNSTRRMSESSFSMSSTGGPLPEVSTYEDLSSSEAISYASDYESWNNLEAAPSLLSPLASPRRPQHDNVVRGGSRSRASPAPHNNVRSSPYTLESNRFKRWSTGQAPTSTPSSRPLAQVQDRFAPYGPRVNPHHSMPAYPSGGLGSFGIQAQSVSYSQPHHLQSSNSGMFASPNQPFHLEVPRPLPSQGIFRLLQSNADHHHGGTTSQFADLSDPPDLYSSLHREPCNPPESDMNPEDPDLVPHEQDLRFGGDMYTPRWVRGHGNKREGFCGLCKPGRWLVLKNSAFWYDKSFTHGVSAATGSAFQGPTNTRRTEGNPDVWEGLCGACGDWIALVSSKKKGTTWFRHAYKCHTHPKVKDGPKRRRETNIVRGRAASSASAASSSYPNAPIKKETPQDIKILPSYPLSLSHSTSIVTPTTVSSMTMVMTPTTHQQQQYVGMPTSLPTSSQPTATFPIAPSASTSSMHSGPTSSSSTGPDHCIKPKEEPQLGYPVVGMFSSPLQPLSTFSGTHLTSLAHNVSEPELVGVSRTISNYNSLVGMI